MRESRRSAGLVLLWLVLSCALFFLADGQADRQEKTRLEAFNSELTNLVQVSEAIMASRLRAYDDTLLALRRLYADDPRNFHRNVQWLRSGPLADRELLVVVVDGGGHLAYTDTPKVKLGIDLHDARYFRYFADGGKDRYFIDEPLFGRVTKRHSVPLARPIYDQRGQFAGVVALSVRQDSLADFGPNLHLSGDTTVTVVSRRGAVVTRSHHLDQVQGTSIAPELLAKISEGNAGVAIDGSPGAERSTAYLSIAETPLIVYVTASAAELKRVAASQRQVLLAIIAFASLLALLLVVGYLKQKKITRDFIATQQGYLTEAQRIAEMGSWELDLDSRRFKWSDGMYALCGMAREHFDPDLERFLARVDRAEQAAVEELLARTAREGSGSLEYGLRRADGLPLCVVMHCEAVRDKAQRVSSLIGTLRNVTERKRDEEQLRIAAAAFESQEGMVVTDANNVILRVNRAFSELTGYTAAEIVGQTPRILKSGRHSDAFYREMWESINRSGSWQGEIWDRRKNGEIYPKALTISALRGADGAISHYIGTQHDITERKRSEEKIKELAYFDQLTGLPNRVSLNQKLAQVVGLAERNRRQFALMLLDLDNFKAINDTLGHLTGDRLLVEVADRLATSVRQSDLVARECPDFCV